MKKLYKGVEWREKWALNVLRHRALFWLVTVFLRFVWWVIQDQLLISQLTESLYVSRHVAHQAGAYFCFSSMKWPGVFLLPPGWDAGPSQGYPQYCICQYPFIHLGGESHHERKVSYWYLRPDKLVLFSFQLTLPVARALAKSSTTDAPLVTIAARSHAKLILLISQSLLSSR